MQKHLLLIIILFGSLAVKGQTFFTEDFASGIPLGWTNVDNSGNNILWRVTTTGASNGNVSVDTVLNTAGTTAANGYLIIDSDSAGQSSTQDAVLTTAAINCSAHSSVHLTFNQYFVQYLSSTATVLISNDNITFTPVLNVDSGVGTGMGTANPDVVDLDITSIAGGQATVYLRFSYHGEWDYWWFIDDVQLYEPPPVELAVLSIENLSSSYTLIPLPQATNLTLSSTIKNNGGLGTSSGTALFEVENVGTTQIVFSETVNLPPIASNATQIINSNTQYIPNAMGIYKSRVTISIAGDANTSNDVMESVQVEISDSVYARDNGILAGVQGIGVGPGEDAITGQNFYVNTSDLLTSVTFFMDEGFGAAANGTPVYFTIHPQQDTATNPDGINVLAVSDTLLFMPGMIPAGGAYYTVAIQGGGVQLSPGLYFVGIHETDSALTLGYSNEIFSRGAVWVHWNSIPPPAVNGWARAEDFSLMFSYMIRANFGVGTINVAELENPFSFMVYPNPAGKQIYLRSGNRKAEESYAVAIYNMQGQEVFKSKWEDKNVYRINVENLREGIYSVVVFSANNSFSKIIEILD